LFYRLDVASLVVPPLRERHEDILALAHHFLSRLHPAKRLSPAAEALLRPTRGQGTQDSLGNVLAQAVALSDGATIDDVHIAEKLSLRHKSSSEARDPLGGLADRVIREAVSLVDLSCP
jgi:DNA-binding NtrC family response regulator